MCVLVLTVVYTRIPILTFNQRYDFNIVEVISTTNLETGIWRSGETSLSKTLVSTLILQSTRYPYINSRNTRITVIFRKLR